ncbi:uncharacterized protein [Ptychodera flava]|uniref:uncharacterized protein n=1 Tax=Ptychodera flava TaxID=63121 RepID=UPI003969E1E0
MEFGAEFDEDLFGETKSRSANVTRTYNAKICEPMWFKDDVDYEDLAEQVQHYIYQGDLLYYQEKFEEAIHYYEKARARLSPSNIALKRMLQESLARCHMNCARHIEAEILAKEMFEESHYLEQKTSAYNLLVWVYHAAGKTLEEQKAVQQLISLQSSNAVLWMKLANTYFVLARQKGWRNDSDETQVADTFDKMNFKQSASVPRTVGQNMKSNSKDLGKHQYHRKDTESPARCARVPVASRTNGCKEHEGNFDAKTSGQNDSTGEHGTCTVSCNDADTGQVNSDNNERLTSECLQEDLLELWISEQREDTVHDRLCCVGCLLMTRLLLFHIQNTVVSFSKVKHKQLSKEVSDKLEELNLPEKLLQNILHSTKCCLYGNNSDQDSFTDGNHIPNDLEQQTQQHFEQKWFPWLPTVL